MPLEIKKNPELNIRRAMVVDLRTGKYEIKTYDDVHQYFGGVGLGVKLFELFREESPLIFSIGPLNGFFPYASKTCIVADNDGVVEDLYVGGNLSMRLKYTGLDALVLINSSKTPVVLDILNSTLNIKDQDTQENDLGLPGKRSVITNKNRHFLVNDYFSAPEGMLEKILTEKNIKAIVITGTELYSPRNFEKYQQVYEKLLSMQNTLKVNQGKYPSCGNCPRGCGKSKSGEIGGNVLIHSMVSCEFAENIYSDIGILFSCLSSLGYSYTHEDIENLPKLIEETLQKLQ